MDGTVLLYLRVIVDRRRKDIDLKLYWPVKRFDRDKGRCLSLSKDDTRYNDHNLILAAAEGKANDIFVRHRLQETVLSLPVFLKEYYSNLNRDSVIEYYRKKMLLRYRQGEINDQSKRNHTSTLNTLEAWNDHLLFSHLNNRTAQLFDTYLARKTGAKTLNGRWAHHKNFKTYLNQAKKVDGIEFVHPYDHFKAKAEVSRYRPLTKDEFLQFWDFYQEPLIHPSHRIVLRAFLFSCVTGIRHGDLRRFTLDWIDGDNFDFVPHKTKRFGTRVRMPITAEAVDLIADEMDEVGLFPLFCSMSEQKQNKYINEVSDLLEIKMPVCFQIARETFATLYMEHDGKLEVLASFMGHTTTKQTEKYVKIMEARKKTESLRISRFMVRD
jgi:integrase